MDSLFFVEAFLLFCHVNISLFIAIQIRRKSKIFKSTFFQIYLLQSVLSYLTYAIIWMDRYHMWPAWDVPGVRPKLEFFLKHFIFYQLFISHSTVVFNRFTSIVFPLRHKELWVENSIYYVALGIVVLASLWSSVRVVLGSLTLRGVEDAWIWADLYNIKVGAVVGTMFILFDLVVSTITIIVYFRMDIVRRKGHVDNFQLLLYCLLELIFQMQLPLYYIQKWFYETFGALPEINVDLMGRALLIFSSPLFLLTARQVSTQEAKVVRRAYLTFLVSLVKRRTNKTSVHVISSN
ncbi:hypothetical protein AAVH_25504 [Aphelenchoides avenae]|nr:hypothetical protein AAVH_25504 [Aphelenchus avenae]